MTSLISRLPGYRFAQCLRDLFVGGDRRTSALLRLSPPDRLFQPFGDTAVDRYPEIFAALQARLEDAEAIRILSFGCSTGEEVFTLRRYFPKAFIKGVDISARRIAVARRRLAKAGEDPRRTTFAVGMSTEGAPEEIYDAVLAMAVFRHGDLADGPDRNTLIDFEDFDRVMTALSRSLRPGGFLALRHSNFRLADASVGSEFETVLSQENITPNYGRDGRRLPYHRLEPCLFRKLQAPA